MTQSKLKSILKYNSDTGIFTRLNGIKKLGIIKNGYMSIQINYKQYQAHRLAWLYTYGSFPNQIDHINHVRHDNRLSNLREVTGIENMKNKGMMSNNKSGVTGVCWVKSRNKWQSAIKHNNKVLFLGRYKTKEEAIRVRREAEIKYGYHINHGLMIQ